MVLQKLFSIFDKILIQIKNMSKFRNFEKYEVYDDGRIWSYSRKKFLKPYTNKKGYQQVVLTDNEGKKKMYKLHRVIYEAVTGSPIPEGMQINHRSEVKTENMITNLEIVSPKENSNYGTRNERVSKSNTNNTKLSKSVGAFKNGELVLTFPSTNEASRNGFKQSAVSMCCRNCYSREGNNKYKGFTWRYI